ncbi:Ig domain-containing protein [Fodinibius saliphilus]|uniref:Ig domain-containing protein n=1 Tax=Fodinibius saliphilus TaxID=1920650 RepID=UPI00110877A2|nr:Ig domain-containing protein [Fodinibius saliphilus]
MNRFLSVLFCLLFLTFSQLTTAQPTLEKDYSYVMEIPSVVTMGSSPAHLYVLSDTEGMAVFRTQKDSLQWLYSSTGMAQRGSTMTADIRFAYLFGNNRRLTVLEPTSVLGVYSATLLPSNPLDAQRIGQSLYVALGDKGLGRLSLETPSTVDSMVTFVSRSKLSNTYIQDIEKTGNQLFALSRNQTLFQFKHDTEDNITTLEREFALSRPLSKIFLVNKTLYGSDADGNIYEIDQQGNLAGLGSIGETVNKIEAWKDWLIISGSSNRIWTSYKNRSPNLWKEDREAGNYFTVSGGTLWLCEYNQLSKIITSDKKSISQKKNPQPNFSGNLELKSISNQDIPHTKPLLTPINFTTEVPANAVKITYQSQDISNAQVRGRSFYWRPSSNDIGRHTVKIIATTSSSQTDSTSFTINVRSFNAPPRFAPIRPITIPVGEAFTLPIQANDPDGSTKNLVRFLGVDMPDGATIDESTGEFNWTPKARQVGKNRFRVIATDQYGAAKSVDITINVIERIDRGTSDS